MAHVVALYRHPVKSFTPERCETLSITPDGRVTGDRILGFRFADAGEESDLSWRNKHHFAALVNTPGLARMRLSFDDSSRRLRIDVGGLTITEGSVDTDRGIIAEAVTDFVMTQDPNPLTDHPERTPLKLIGDGVTGRFHDSEAGGVTLHSVESAQALAKAIGRDEIDSRRFRSNVVIEGTAAWEELGWAGRKVRIGQIEFEVVKTVTRCLATHANPVTGSRDLGVMTALQAANGRAEPTFAVRLTTAATGEINVGDELVC